MNIDWTHFTPLQSLLGGAMIGLAALLFILLYGRILGISGIVGGLFAAGSLASKGWRIRFLLGVLAAPLLWRLLVGAPQIEIATSTFGLIVAGLLVGIGTRYGSGCTSGHGVCGLSRLSLRSLLATLCFMGSGFATVYVLRHSLA